MRAMSNIQIIHGDCMPAMKAMPDKAYELAIVDPPYGIGLKIDGEVAIIANKSVNPKFAKKNWDDSTPPQEYFNELIRVTKKQIIWGGNHFAQYLGYCKAPIVWDKLNGDSPYADGEMAWTGGDKMPRNLKIWRHQWCGAFKASERGVVNIHPTQKPVALYQWLLKNYAKPGDKILDTHGGSCSLAIACDIMGFDAVIYEIDLDYYTAAVERFNRHKQQTVLEFV